MKMHWEPYDGGNDFDLVLTLDDGRKAHVAFVRPVYVEDKLKYPEYDTRWRWVARSFLGDFTDEDVPLKSKRAAMLKARRETPALWIAAAQETRNAVIDNH